MQLYSRIFGLFRFVLKKINVFLDFFEHDFLRALSLRQVLDKKH